MNDTAELETALPRADRKHHHHFKLEYMKFNPKCCALALPHSEPLNLLRPDWRQKLESQQQRVSLLALGQRQEEIKKVLY